MLIGSKSSVPTSGIVDAIAAVAAKNGWRHAEFCVACNLAWLGLPKHGKNFKANSVHLRPNLAGSQYRRINPLQRVLLPLMPLPTSAVCLFIRAWTFWNWRAASVAAHPCTPTLKFVRHRQFVVICHAQLCQRLVLLKQHPILKQPLLLCRLQQVGWESVCLED